MNPDFEIEHLDPKELRANPLNFRRHPETQRTALAGSLAEHGWLAAPIWNKRSGHLLDGHARVELAVENAEELIPVRVIDVPVEQERRILRVFDAVGSMAEEDPLALDRLIEEIGDVDLERLLGEITEPASGLLPEADPDAIPEVVETRAKAGDLWLLGEHRLLCGDCTVATDVERLMGGDIAGAVVTDPPYGVEREGITNDSEAGLADLFRESLSLLPARNAVVFAFQSPRLFPVWLDAVREAGQKFERALWFYIPLKAPGLAHNWRGWLLKSDIVIASSLGSPEWESDYEYTHDCHTHEFQHQRTDEGGWHASVKPTDYVAELISRTKGLVFDGFAGSGTTLIACEQTGRAARCIEIEPRYVDVCLARWEQATGKSARLAE